ncbi:MAG: hypothetical protein BWY73_01628 [candidate division TA06 bacterium ADurb.Bin417]|uniref:Uncharacterized protein n=1 Tax=candidate division TA06 bacterium ADurb.Bin417 TaxID=1852828 RepID=A0A1V5M676_UNCT6|nr:MAG: hypothetical protein BWY73_01628 [candidate division TA06 bacterium ADurb.Bin417]
MLGVILLVKSQTERDRPFVKALREARPKLGGKAITLTTTGPAMPGITAETKLPLIRVLDAHGTVMDELQEVADLARLPELARELTEHHH